MGQVMVVTSGKGGTGKTTLCAGLAAGLAQLDQQVLCIDADIGLRNLDLSLGMADAATVPFTEALGGGMPLSAAPRHPLLPRLALLTAPVRTAPVDAAAFRALLAQARESFDWILIDAPAGIGEGFRLSSAYADRALVVATADPASLRDAGRAAQLLRRPGMGERVTVETWHRQRKGPRFYRCYRWVDAGGAEIIRGVMEFALVSTADHRLLRGEELDRFAIPAQPERGVDCADPGRLRLPELASVGAYRVRPSDADMNGHMNNTHYADLCEDQLPPGMAVGEITLQFLHESRPGETVALEFARQGAALYLRGSRGETPVFAAEMVLTEDGYGA